MRRNSGFATSNSTARESHTTIATDVESAYSIRHSPSLPRITTKHDSVPSLRSKSRKWSGYKIKQVEAQEQVPRVPRLPFKRIATDIPTSSFEDLTSPGKIEFSNRGSMLIGGQKVTGLDRRANSHAIMTGNPRQPSTSASVPTSTVPSRVLSADDEILSRQVRSMYDSGTDKDEVLVAGNPLARNRAEAGEENVDVDRTSSTPSRTDDVSTTSKPVVPHDRSASCATTVKSGRESMIQREIHELAGGVEDWEDVSSSDVDRYGFIVPQLPSRGSSSTSQNVAPPERLQLQRVSTSLQIASEAPRRQRSKLGRSPSNKGSTRSPTIPASAEKPLRRPSTSQRSYQSTFDRQPSRIRSTTNFLPYNRDRRWKDEAGDMLTLPPGLADIAEHEDSGKVAIELKRKEWEREEKWRKMGKVVSTRHVGGGMIFEFDTKNPKLIERTWKGIPDRWRASAWHAFLTASAKRRPGSPTDEQLIAEFHELMVQSSPDDVQIDIDVPRTINSHIMFRRRYRGGQRLLFRVLHCLSIYFPDTGYVQGMAALAATLLCYYDEELTFVMLVRLWQLRGLARLYQSGFEGLMEALDDFEKNWLAGGEIAAKLVSLSCPFDAKTRCAAPRTGLTILIYVDRSWYLPNGLRYPVVSHPLQLLHPLPRPAPHLGRLHASRGCRRPFRARLFQPQCPIHPDSSRHRRPRRAPRYLRCAHRRDARHPS